MAVRFDDLPDERPAAKPARAAAPLTFDDIPDEAPRQIRVDMSSRGAQPLLPDEVPDYSGVFAADPPSLGQAIYNRLQTGVIQPVAGGVRAIGETLAPDIGALSPGAAAAVDAILPQRRLGDVLVREAGVATDLATGLRREAGGVRPTSIGNALENPGNTLRYYGGMAAESLPLIGAAVLARRPDLANTIISAGTGAQQYADLRGEGLSQPQALREAVSAAIAEGAGGRPALEAAFDAAPLISRLGRAAALESAGEAGSEGLQTAMPAMTGRADVSTDELVRAMVDAAIVGAPLGAVEAIGASPRAAPATPSVGPVPSTPFGGAAPADPLLGQLIAGMRREDTADLDALLANLPVQPAAAGGVGAPVAAPAGPVLPAVTPAADTRAESVPAGVPDVPSQRPLPEPAAEPRAIAPAAAAAAAPARAEAVRAEEGAREEGRQEVLGEEPARGVAGADAHRRAAGPAPEQAPLETAARAYPLAPEGQRYEEIGNRQVAWMTPDEFLSRVRPLDVDEASRDNIDDLKAHIQAGRLLDPLHIRESGQEDGRHRAVAAKELGIDQIPVVDEQVPEGSGIRGRLADRRSEREEERARFKPVRNMAQRARAIVEDGGQFRVQFNDKTVSPGRYASREDAIDARDQHNLQLRRAAADPGAELVADVAEESRRSGNEDADRSGLRAEVNRVLGPIGGRVEYLRGNEGLPENLRRVQEARAEQRENLRTAALYDPRSKRVYLFTDVVTDPARAAFHAAHEIAGHHGLRTLLGDKLDSALGIARQNPTVKAVADAIAGERNLDLKSQRGILLSAEEALAELAAAVRTGDYGAIESRYKVPVPEGVRTGLKQAIANFLKRLRAMIDDLFGSHVFTDEDVRALLENAWQAANDGETITSAGGETLESVSPEIDLSPGGPKEVKIGDTTIEYGISRDGETGEVILIRTPPAAREQGSARAAMEEFLRASDDAGLTMFLTAEPMGRGGASKAALKRFYKSLGFRDNTGRRADFRSRQGMVRDPDSPSILESVAEAEARAEQRREEAAETLPVDRGTPGWNYDTGVWEGASGTAKRARMQLQDKMTGWEDVQNQISSQVGAAIPDAQNVYQAENLMHGRVGEAIKRLEEQQIKPLMAALKAAKVSVPELEEYLYARHAEERNQQIARINPDMPDGGSGMTTAQANKILADARPEVRQLSGRVDAITRGTRRRLLEHGLIDQATFDAMEAAYEHYVPLRGQRDGDLVEGSPGGAGRGLDTRRAPTKRALGRGEGNLAENILAEVIGDAMRSIVTAEKARVGRTVMRLALANPNPDLWTVEPVQTERALDSQGQVYERVVNDWNDPAVIGVRHNGKLYKVRIEQPELAQALNHVGVDQLGTLTRVAGAFNRYLSAMLTKYNPAFTGVNAVRDALFGLTGMAAEKGEQAALRAALKYPVAAASSFKAAHGRLGDSKMDRWAKEFAEHGGRTGYVNMPSVEDISRKIGNGKITSYSPSGLARAASTAAEQIEHVNDAVENALRLAAYATLREDGVSADQAATYAKNLTVNFNRKGLQGSAINSWFLFYNASLQGTKRFADVARKPKTWAYLGALATAQVIATMAMLGMEDDDGVPLWDKIPDHVKARNLVLPAGKDGTHFMTVPMPYGFNMMTYMGGRVTDAFARPKKKQNTIGQIVADTASNLTQAFSPVPLDDGALGLVPTVARIPIAVQVNRDSFGREIRKEDPYAAAAVPRASMGRPDTIEIFKATAKGLNRIGGGDDFTPAPLSLFDRAPEDLEFLASQLTGGAGRFVLDTARAAGTLADPGVELEARKVPLANKFFANVSDVDTHRGLFYDRRETIETSLRRVRSVARQDGVAAAQRLMASMPELQGARLKRTKGGAVRGGETGEIQFEGAPGSLFKAYRDAAKATKARGEEIEDAYVDAPAGVVPNAKTRARDQKIRAADDRAMQAQRAFNAKWTKATEL